MIAFKRDSDMPYKMHCTPEDVSLICNQEKEIPKGMDQRGRKRYHR